MRDREINWLHRMPEKRRPDDPVVRIAAALFILAVVAGGSYLGVHTIDNQAKSDAARILSTIPTVTVPPPTPDDVVFTVDSNSAIANVSYTDASGVVQENHVALDSTTGLWRVTRTIPSSVPLTITAQSLSGEPNVFVVCGIGISHGGNFTNLTTNQSQGPYAVVSCSGIAP